MILVSKLAKHLVFQIFGFLLFFLLPHFSLAATLQVSPGTGVYSINSTFSARVTVNADGKSINAAEGNLTFNPQELSVISVNRNSSVFNLWVTEPTFSNSAGTISFSGGSPTGYLGNGGTVFTVTFKALRAGTTRASFKDGSVLANDGKGTNVLSGMSGGTFTIEATALQPTPEVVEYVAPANTPAAPKITSDTHKPDAWSQQKTAILNWTLPNDITAVRTLLDSVSSAVPTKVYDNPIKTITLEDLPEGESYFHLQFKNAEGWGKVTNYRLAVDTAKPESVTVSFPENVDKANPEQVLKVVVVDKTSPVTRFMVRIDDREAFEFIDKEGKGLITLPTVSPGYHSVIVEAFDAAGNGQIGTFSFTQEAFEKPVFTEYPSEINEEVIPVIRGTTRENAEVTIIVKKIGAAASTYNVSADAGGLFTFIPESRFAEGVYEIQATARDKYGAQSLPSEKIRIAVQQPGYIQIGNQVVSFLSVAIPLLALLVLLVLLFFWLVLYIRKFRSKVSFESKEALTILNSEFSKLKSTVESEITKLTSAKKTKKLSVAETETFAVISDAIKKMQIKVIKEVEDVENLVDRDNDD